MCGSAEGPTPEQLRYFWYYTDAAQRTGGWFDGRYMIFPVKHQEHTLKITAKAEQDHYYAKISRLFGGPR